MESIYTESVVRTQTKAVQTAVETCLVEPYPLKLDLIEMCGAHYGVDADKDGIRFLREGATPPSLLLMCKLLQFSLVRKQRSFHSPKLEKTLINVKSKLEAFHPVMHLG